MHDIRLIARMSEETLPAPRGKRDFKLAETEKRRNKFSAVFAGGKG